MRGVASTRGSAASVIRVRGIGDQNVCLSPRALAFSPLPEARKDRAHPRLPWPLRQTRPQSHVECSQAHISTMRLGPPLGCPGHPRYPDRLLYCGGPQSLALLVHRARHKRSFAASRCLGASTRGARPIDTPPPVLADHPLPDGEGASSRCRALDNTHRDSPEVDR